MTNSAITYRYRQERDACFDRYKRRREQTWQQFNSELSEQCKAGMETAWHMLKYELALNDRWLDEQRDHYGLRRAA